jgi:hypothetical protein
MTNSHAILIGSALVTAAILFSNGGASVNAQSGGQAVIPPVEALVPANEAPAAGGPWHIWRINRHTGQLSFCTAERPPPQSGQASQPQAPMVDCTKTSPAM